MARRFALGCALLGICVLVGCGSKIKMVPVSGTVDLDKKPLLDGSITLVGEGGAPPNVIEVKDGKFDGQATPGKKRVEIRAYRQGKSTKMGTEIIEGGPENYLPAGYNTDSKMTAEVGADGGLNPSTFDVKSK